MEENLSGRSAAPYEIQFNEALSYEMLVDANGVVDRTNSTVSTIAGGQTLTLKLSDVLPQESFAEAYLRLQAENGDPLAVAEYKAFVENQTTSVVDAALEIVERAREIHCFPVGTSIAVADTGSRAIETIAVGVSVLAYGENGALVPAIVTRLYQNVTQEFLKLIPYGDEANVASLVAIPPCSDIERDPTATYVTPGHRYMSERGYEPIIEIVKRGGMIQHEDGSWWRVHAERLVYSEATAAMFPQAEVVRHTSSGGNALEPVIERGWATYNFEVAKHHNYIANGWRVHNDSQFYIDIAGAIGQAFGSQLGMLS